MQAPEAAPRLPTAAGLARQALDALDRAVAFLVVRPYATLAGLAVLQWLAILGYALTVRHNGWIFYQGGDQIWLVTTGWLLGQGELGPPEVGYGWPLLLAPLTWITGPSFVDAMPWVIGFNVLILGPLLLWTLYELGGRIAGRAFGLLAAAAWVVMPFAVIPLWRDDYHERYIEQFLPGALGLSGLADFQSMVLLLVGSVLFLRSLQRSTWPEAVAAGFVVGFAVGTKPSNGLYVAAPVAAALIARNLRPLLPFALALVPALVALAVWKQRGFGSLPAFAAEETRLALGVAAGVPLVDRYVDLDWAHLHDNASNLREYFWSARLLEWAPIAGTVAIARRSPPLAALLATWFGVFLVIKGTTVLSTVSTGSFFRFLMPAFPAYFLLAVSIPLLVPTLGRRLAARWPPDAPRPVGRRLVLGLGVLLAAVPLALVALVRPIETPAKAIAVNTIVTPVDERIRVSVKPDREARIVTWSHPPAGSSDVFYRVYRTGRNGLEQKCLDHGGAAECSLEMILLGTTRARRWRDGSPPPGVRYRVGVAANSRNDPSGGDVATLSPPVESP